MSVLDEIAAERRRQIEVEGYTPEHDDMHGGGHLADAAAAYAITVDKNWDPHFAPWPIKRKDRRDSLVKAGALIVAEIERLDRVEASAAEPAPAHHK